MDVTRLPVPARWDVAVVGAGPAGCAAALAVLAARPSAGVLLLDRADFPRDKACGDGVAPHVLDVLARLGVRGLLDDLVPVDRLRLGFPGGPQALGRMRRPAYVVPRAVLDARLVAAAVRAGGVLVRHRVRAVRPDGDGVELDPGGPTPIRAAVVVAADGANSVVRAALRLPDPPSGTRAIAIRGYAGVQPRYAGQQVIAFATGGSWPAYAWSFPIGDGRANVGYGQLLGRDGAPAPGRAAMIASLDALLPGSVDGALAWRGQHLPLSTGRVRQPDGRVLLAGDALGLVNPLTGEGIHAAVLSGALAGLAAARALAGGPAPGRTYRTALHGALGRHHRHVGLLARTGAHRAIFGAGLRAAQRSTTVFDDLVELGLADGALTVAVVGGVLADLARPLTPRRPGS